MKRGLDVFRRRVLAAVGDAGRFGRGVVGDLVDLFLAGDGLAFEPTEGETMVACWCFITGWRRPVGHWREKRTEAFPRLAGWVPVSWLLVRADEGQGGCPGIEGHG